MLVFGRRDPSTGDASLCRISALGSELLLLDLADILSLLSGKSALSYRASVSLSTMPVNGEATHLVASLVPFHFELIKVCPGVGQPGGNTPGCTEEAQAVNGVQPSPS